jgi:two-component system, probable response regulator PhcQ
MTSRILLVDDEPNIISSLQRVLLEEPYEIISAGSAEEGLKLLETTRFKVVISDERMPGMGGAEFLSIIRNSHPETVRILLTGYASLEAAMEAVNGGEIYRFFMKPWDDLQLILAIRSAVERYDLEEENRRLLGIVRRQARELKVIEERFPGISSIERDEDGSITLPEMSDEEMEQIRKQCG